MKTGIIGRISLAALAVLFIGAGIFFIPHAGIQTDEALFAHAIYPQRCSGAEGWIRVAGIDLPLMLMTYVGALKGWLFLAIFSIWTPSVWSVRLPPLLFAAAAIPMSARVAAMLAGPRAGVITAALLATDATYLLTSTLDWGPVALQHFLLALAAWRFLSFARSGSRAALALSGFAVGLAMWNKAIAAWMLAGLAAGALVAARPELARLASWRNAALFAASFSIGAAPLLWFNATHSFATVRDNVKSDPGDLAGTARMLLFNLEGSVMEGYVFTEAQPDSAPPPRTNLLPWALLAAIPLTPLAAPAARRVCLFLAVAIAVSWLVMTQAGGGGAAHHAVLLWPLPHLWIAVAAASMLGRRPAAIRVAVWTLMAAVCCTGAAQIARFHQMARQGVSAPGWSDAILPLSGALEKYRGRWVIAADWGLLSNLCLLTPGPLFSSLDMEPNDAAFQRVFAIPDAVIVAPRPEIAVVPAMREGLMAYVKAKGIELIRVAAVHDARGRLVFEVFAFRAGMVR